MKGLPVTFCSDLMRKVRNSTPTHINYRALNPNKKWYENSFFEYKLATKSIEFLIDKSNVFWPIKGGKNLSAFSFDKGIKISKFQLSLFYD